MYKKLENDAIQFTLGPSYMEDDVRMETNKVGFCKRHMAALYKEQNRLGLALMLHTHLQKINKEAGNIIKGRIPLPFFGKDPNSQRLANFLEKTHDCCYICKRVDDTFERYIDTFFMLWARGGDETRLIKSQKSYCIPHFTTLLDGAENKLGRGKRERFYDDIIPAWQAAMLELEGDLEWFTLKFDFRNKDEPWKNSKDALPRALELLAGSE